MSSVRHYSYECKESLQDRPYRARPSRTQQLSNPKLVPKLSEDIPNDLVRKKGVADEQLAIIEAERKRARSDSASSPSRLLKKAGRSRSDSGSSISTISTNLSHSRSRSRTPEYSKPLTQDPDRMLFSQQQSQPLQAPSLSRKRRHSSTSASSEDGYARQLEYLDRSRVSDDRNTRRRRSSISPESRGRTPRHERASRRSGWGRDDSRDRSEIVKHRQSLTPDQRFDSSRRDGHRHGPQPHGAYSNGHTRRSDKDRHGISNGRRSYTPPQEEFDEPRPGRRAVTPRERSLSPYSKRLALTQALSR